MGGAAWNTESSGILRLQLSELSRNEGDGPLMVSISEREVGSSGKHICSPFPGSYYGAEPAGVGQIISAVEGSKPQRLGKGRT